MKLEGGMWLPDDDNYFGQIFEKEGGFQLDRLAIALSHVSKFDVALDVGAHVGSWTKVMAERFGKVMAFEPVKSTFECLERNMYPHSNALTFNAALNDKAGHVTIGWDKKYASQGNTGSKFVKEVTEGEILAYSLDDLNLDILDFLKLDVEGAEYNVLKGGERTILTTRPVIILESKKGYGSRFGVSDDAAIELLKGFGATQVDRINADYIFMFK